MTSRGLVPLAGDTSLLIADGDQAFSAALADEMQTRGFAPQMAATVDEAVNAIRRKPPAYAVIELQLDDGTAFDILDASRKCDEQMRVIVLTGYGELSHVVAAIKLGAIDYLTKPSDPDAIEYALRAVDGSLPPPPEIVPDTADLRWDHIMRTYHACEGNVTAAAERLKMHRRTLQRMLKKRNIPRPYEGVGGGIAKGTEIDAAGSHCKQHGSL